MARAANNAAFSTQQQQNPEATSSIRSAPFAADPSVKLGTEQAEKQAPDKKKTDCGNSKLNGTAMKEDSKENIYNKNQPVKQQVVAGNELTLATKQSAAAYPIENGVTRHAIEDLAELHRKQMLKEAKEALKKK